MLEHKKDNKKAFLALLPTLIFMAVFTFYPIIKTFITAFLIGYNPYKGWKSVTGIGFQQFGVVLKDPLFQIALKNTFYMVFISVPISVVVALMISVALNSIKRLQGFFQTIFFLPYVTNTIALGLVFSFMFSSQFGLINSIITSFGGKPVAWTAMLGNQAPTYTSAMFVLMVYTIWNGLAFKILVFLSGMQSIDKQYYQAAQIDATPRWRVFLKITVPLLSPMIAYIMITSLIGAFKAYSSVIAVFNGRFGPLAEPDMLITIVGYIYEKVKLSANTNILSQASAGSLILFAIIMVITLIQLYFNKKKVHY